MYIHRYIPIQCIHTHVQVNTYTCIYMHIHIQVHAYTCTHVYIYMKKLIHIYHSPHLYQDKGTDPSDGEDRRDGTDLSVRRKVGGEVNLRPNIPYTFTHILIYMLHPPPTLPDRIRARSHPTERTGGMDLMGILEGR